jgi:hypothetical protein
MFFFRFLKSPNNKKLINSTIKTCPKLTLIYFKNIFNFYSVIPYNYKRPIVQLVERAAHNGFVVGSNPARPIYFKINYFSNGFQLKKLSNF